MANAAAYLREINAESIHVQAVEKGCEAFAEAREGLVHELQLHEVLLQVGHGVAELGKAILEIFEGVRGGGIRCAASRDRVAEGGARGRAQGGGGAGDAGARRFGTCADDAGGGRRRGDGGCGSHCVQFTPAASKVVFIWMCNERGPIAKHDLPRWTTHHG